MIVTKFLFLTIVIMSAVNSNWSSRKKDPCYNYHCAHGGTCVPKSDNGYRRNCQQTPTCQCAGSWKGERCDDDPCDGIDCNTGTCSVDESGIPSCLCPPRCSGRTCAIEDDRECVLAGGQCLDSETCGKWAKINKPCCNWKVCCLQDFEELIGCDGLVMSLSCAEGYLLNIKSATYGRDDNTICSQQTTESCTSSVDSIIQAECNGKDACSIPVGPGPITFPDPCPPNTLKYLRVIYGCFN